jgi:hypothetical protein
VTLGELKLCTPQALRSAIERASGLAANWLAKKAQEFLIEHGRSPLCVEIGTCRRLL